MTEDRFRHLGPRIKARRDALGWRQIDLAERAFISRAFVAQIETGRSVPSLDVLDRIASALGVTLDELRAVEREVSPTPEERAFAIHREVVNSVEGVAIRVRMELPSGRETEECVVRLSHEQLRGAREPFGLRVSTDAYRAWLLIASGDVVIADAVLGRTPEPGQLVIVQLDSELAIRRWQPTPQGIDLQDGDGSAVTYRQARDVGLVGLYVTYVPGQR